MVLYQSRGRSGVNNLDTAKFVVKLINTDTPETYPIGSFASHQSAEWTQSLERKCHIVLMYVPPIISVSDIVVMSDWLGGPLMGNLYMDRLDATGLAMTNYWKTFAKVPGLIWNEESVGPKRRSYWHVSRKQA